MCTTRHAPTLSDRVRTVAHVDSETGDLTRRENRYRARGRVAPWLRERGVRLGPDGNTFVPLRYVMDASGGQDPYRRAVARCMILRLVSETTSQVAADPAARNDAARSDAVRVKRQYRLALERVATILAACAAARNALLPTHPPDVRPPPRILTATLTVAANAPGSRPVAA